MAAEFKIPSMHSFKAFNGEIGNLPSRVSSNADVFDVVRRQLYSIQDKYFLGDRDAAQEELWDGGKMTLNQWHESCFLRFIKFPVISGYALGLVDSILQYRELPLSPTDIFRVVLTLDSAFTINNVDINLAPDFVNRGASYSFGLSMGGRDVVNYLTSQNASGRASYGMLFSVLELLLRNGSGASRTTVAELLEFCEGKGIDRPSPDAASRIIELWREHKNLGGWATALRKI